MNLQSIGVEDVITVHSSGDTDVIQVGIAMNVRCGYATVVIPSPTVSYYGTKQFSRQLYIIFLYHYFKYIIIYTVLLTFINFIHDHIVVKISIYSFILSPCSNKTLDKQ